MKQILPHRTAILLLARRLLSTPSVSTKGEVPSEETTVVNSRSAKTVQYPRGWRSSSHAGQSVLSRYCRRMDYLRFRNSHVSHPRPDPCRADIQECVECLEPPPLPGLQDYDGPLKKTVGLFGRALERKSVHQPHYKPGVLLCSLDVKGKFLLFVDDFLDPVTFLSAGFDAGQDQASKLGSDFRTSCRRVWKTAWSGSRGSGLVQVLHRPAAFSACGGTPVRGPSW
jgi:hypothetical protein